MAKNVNDAAMEAIGFTVAPAPEPEANEETAIAKLNAAGWSTYNDGTGPRICKAVPTKQRNDKGQIITEKIRKTGDTFLALAQAEGL